MSLSTSFLSRCRSTAANSGKLATPELIRPAQCPLGAYHLPQALIPWLTFVTEAPLNNSGGLVLAGVAGLSSRFHPHGSTAFGMSRCIAYYR